MLPAEVSVVSGVDPFEVPMKVLHVWQPVEAGVPRYANAAARFQADRGWEVHTASPEPHDHAGIVSHRWDSQRNPAKGLRSESRALRKIIDEVAPRVVVAHSAKAGLVVRATVRGAIPTVFVPHAWSHLSLPAAAKPLALGWERWAARWTNALVAVGESEAEEGVRRGVRAPMFVVRNPVPPGWEYAGPAERGRARRDLGLPHGPIAVCVGRFSRQKGQDLLVAAWREVVTHAPEATLVLVGDGPTRMAIESTAGDRVLFPGATDDPRPYLAAADVAVMPSRWEGLSLAMLEAMASGRSLVVTDVAGAEVVRRSGGGAVVPVDDPASLAAAVVERLTGRVDIEAEGRRGHDWVERNHDFDTEMSRFAAVITRAHAFGR